MNSHSREFEYIGQEHSKEIIVEVKDELNLKIPLDSIGLAYKYFPPIDPMVFAKIQLSESGKDEFIKNLGEITYYKSFPRDFANDRCSWWNIDQESLEFSKIGILNHQFVEIYILKDKEIYYLYIKKFTI
ncbi:MAG: hypothetical protein ACOYXC_09555 [Candidatus Rifleibacteriota bacterium]